MSWLTGYWLSKAWLIENRPVEFKFDFRRGGSNFEKDKILYF